MTLDIDKEKKRRIFYYVLNNITLKNTTFLGIR